MNISVENLGGNRPNAAICCKGSNELALLLRGAIDCGNILKFPTGRDDEILSVFSPVQFDDVVLEIDLDERSLAIHTLDAGAEGRHVTTVTLDYRVFHRIAGRAPSSR